jgi:hypothetical protein
MAANSISNNYLSTRSCDNLNKFHRHEHHEKCALKNNVTRLELIVMEHNEGIEQHKIAIALETRVFEVT